MESPTRILRVIPSQVTWGNYYKGIFGSPTLKTLDSEPGACSKPGQRLRCHHSVYKVAEGWLLWWHLMNLLSKLPRSGTCSVKGSWPPSTTGQGPRSCHQACGCLPSCHPGCPCSSVRSAKTGSLTQGTWLSSGGLQIMWFQKLPSWLTPKVYSKAALTAFIL